MQVIRVRKYLYNQDSTIFDRLKRNATLYTRQIPSNKRIKYICRDKVLAILLMQNSENKTVQC